MTVEGVIHAAIRQKEMATDETAFWCKLLGQAHAQANYRLRTHLARLIRDALAPKLKQTGAELDVVLRRLEWVNPEIGVALELSVRVDSNTRAQQLLRRSAVIRDEVPGVVHDAVEEALGLKDGSQRVFVGDVFIDGFTTGLLDHQPPISRSFHWPTILVSLAVILVLVGACAVGGALFLLRPQYSAFEKYQERQANCEMPARESADAKLTVQEFNGILQNLAVLRAQQYAVIPVTTPGAEPVSSPNAALVSTR